MHNHNLIFLVGLKRMTEICAQLIVFGMLYDISAQELLKCYIEQYKEINA
jgi:hypothetical protein